MAVGELPIDDPEIRTMLCPVWRSNCGASASMAE